MKVLLDVNIVLDALQAREPWRADAESLWAACDARRISGHLAAITLTTIFYIVAKAAPREKAFEAVDVCMKAFDIVPVSADTLAAARALPGTDFEDNVQIACAVAAEAEVIVTRNRDDFAASPVRVMSPKELLAALPKS